MSGFLFQDSAALAVLWWESMFRRLDLEKNDTIFEVMCYLLYCTTRALFFVMLKHYFVL